MYQTSSAVAYMHELGICHCAIGPGSVLLMQRAFTDPIAKLANFSQCQTKFWFFKKDTMDFTHLLYMLTASKDFGRPRDAEPPPLLEPLKSCPPLAGLIRAAWSGDLSAARIRTRLNKIE